MLDHHVPRRASAAMLRSLSLQKLEQRILLAGDCEVATAGGELIEESFIYDSARRDYGLYVPSAYSPGEPLPLVINMHGYTLSRQQQMNFSNMNQVAECNGFLVVYPQGEPVDGRFGLAPGWDEADVGFTLELIDEISADYQVDRQMIYATGFSMGGDMALRLAEELPDTIAAVASVTGHYDVKTTLSMPVMQIHGTADTLVPFSNIQPAVIDAYARVNRCNPEPEVTELEDIDPSDGTTVELHTYTECSSYVGRDGVSRHSDLLFYIVQGGNHNWPGDNPEPPGYAIPANFDFSASNTIWEFFSRHVVAAYPFDTQVGGEGTIGSSSLSQRGDISSEATVTASSVASNRRPLELLVDGDLTTSSSTSSGEEQWVELSFPDDRFVTYVNLYNNSSNGRGLVDGSGFRVTLLNSAGDAILSKDFVDLTYSEPFNIGLGESPQARTMRLEKIAPVDTGSRGRFNLKEIVIWGGDVLANGNRISIELDATANTHDVLIVPGGLNVDGAALSVINLRGDVTQGQRFHIIQADSISGTFTSVDLPTLADGLNWDTSDLLSKGLIEVVAGGNTDCNEDGVTDVDDLNCVSTLQARDELLADFGLLAGDLNGDGEVGFRDFLILSSNYEEDEQTYAKGDIDLNGVVNFEDFLVIASNFGATRE